MNKRAFLTSLPCLAVLPWARVQAADVDGSNLDPEACAAQPPWSMWNARVTVAPQESSEQAQTRFYEAYASCLGDWTQLKHPEAKELRTHIHEAWHQAMSFVVFDVNGGVIHVMPRLPAETEWIIWDGLERGFDRAQNGRHTHAMISKLLVMIFEAHAEPSKKLEASMPRVKQSLAALSEAEKHLSEIGRAYFRGHLVKTVSQWL